MKTLHLYLTRHVLTALLMTVAVFTFVLLLANVLREVLALLVSRQTDLLTVLQAIVLLVPFVLVFALPMGMLTATLLVFGRFSADHELTAARAGGTSLVALISPVLLLSVALSGLCAWINMQIAPQCRVAYKRLLYEAGVKTGTAMLTEKTFIKDIPGYIVYVDKVDGANLTDVLIIQLDGPVMRTYIRAAAGQLHLDAARHTVRVQLQDAWRVDLVDGKWRPVYAGEWELPEKQLVRPVASPTKLSDMTFLQLRDELRDWEKRFGAAIPLQSGAPNSPEHWARLWKQHLADLTMPVKVQLHRQVSFSFACLGFTLVGIPLGIRAHRRETTFGIAVALLLVTLYYSFFVLAQALDTQPEWAPHLVLWAPNFLFQAVGLVLLWRANRGI